MVAISKVGNFRTRLSLSEILSDLIRCKLVRYPWFCSARPRSFTCFKKWQMCITRIEVNFPLKVNRPSDFCFEIRYLMYLSIFVRVAKNLALYPRFMLSMQHVSVVVHNL